MKRLLQLALVLALVLSCALPSPAGAALTGQASPGAGARPPGVALAHAVSTVTGVAISPLLGAGAVGAWKYTRAHTDEERAKLPWFAQPWFWVPALIIVGLCSLKDTFGIVVPAALKKPFDVLETAQHKLSALILAGAFVPLVASVFQEAGADPSSLNASLAGGGAVMFGAINLSWLYNAIAVPLLIAAFVVVFLASNAINTLILLSPLSIVNTALKAFRLGVLATVAGTAFINPYLGAIWSLIIICIAYFIAGWSLRLSFFGLAFVWDFLTLRRKRFTPDPTVNWMFLGRKTEKVPIRTYGKVRRDTEGKFVFDYRSWFMLPQRTLILPAGAFVAGQGLIYSEILRLEGERARPAFLLSQRYRSHESELVAIYGLDGVRSTGLRAAFAWFKDLVGFRPKPDEAGAALVPLQDVAH